MRKDRTKRKNVRLKAEMKGTENVRNKRIICHVPWLVYINIIIYYLM
jgi:hypothetical protein